MDLIPLFSSHNSIGKSILTLDEPDEIKENSPTSIFSIAKKHNLKDIYLRDNSFSGFISAYKVAAKNEVNLRFGLKVKVCQDLSADGDNIKSTSSSLCIWILNTQGYKDLIKLHSKQKEGKIDWNILKKYFTENLYCSIPFYNNFLHVNSMKLGKCVPDFGPIRPIMEHSPCGLPFDIALENLMNTYSRAEKLDLMVVQPCYYYKKDGFLAYQVHRINCSRTYFVSGDKLSFTNPGIEFFCSDGFSFEDYMWKIGQPLI